LGEEQGSTDVQPPRARLRLQQQQQQQQRQQQQRQQQRILVSQPRSWL
jgi:hypothetical protein